MKVPQALINLRLLGGFHLFDAPLVLFDLVFQLVADSLGQLVVFLQAGHVLQLLVLLDQLGLQVVALFGVLLGRLLVFPQSLQFRLDPFQAVLGAGAGLVLTLTLQTLAAQLLLKLGNLLGLRVAGT